MGLVWILTHYCGKDWVDVGFHRLHSLPFLFLSILLSFFYNPFLFPPPPFSRCGVLHDSGLCVICQLLALGMHAQEGYCSRVCVSVKSHLTSGVSVRPENTVTYSAGNGGQNICKVFCETAPLQRSSTSSIESQTFGQPFSC